MFELYKMMKTSKPLTGLQKPVSGIILSLFSEFIDNCKQIILLFFVIYRSNVNKFNFPVIYLKNTHLVDQSKGWANRTLVCPHKWLCWLHIVRWPAAILSPDLRKILQDNSGRHKRNFNILLLVVLPVQNIFNIFWLHLKTITVTNSRFQ